MEISVIIATYNRKASLATTLNALLGQDYSTKNYEIIVVDDGSRDGTAELLAQFRSFHPELIRFYHQKNAGPASARNLGIQKAKGQIIAFTDDDCVPAISWLTEIHNSFRIGNVAGVQGSTYTDRDLITPLTHQIDNEEGNNSVPTCNAAYLKSVLEKVNGFDEHFPRPHNEDADLAWRVQPHGRIGFNKFMRVYHPPREDSFEKVAARMKIMESEFRLYYKNPRSYRLYRGQSPWHTIYWEVGMKTQWYYLKSRFKYLTRPTLLIKGIALTLRWWVDLIRLFPVFIREEKINRKALGFE